MEIVKLGEPLLAEVRGIDISQPLDADAREAINRAFLEHCVLVFRDRELTPAQMVRFESVFGTPLIHVTKKYRHPEIDELIVMTNLNAEGEVDEFESRRGLGWHSDMCYLEVPAKATMLHPLEIPDEGGDTLFANMYLALEEMPAELKERLQGLRGTFRFGGRSNDVQNRLDPADRDKPLINHPVIRRHPETGRESIFVNPIHTVGILGMPDEEAVALLDEVYEWCGQSRYQARHQWRMGDTLVWDNRCTWHSATGDNPLRQRRRFLRGNTAETIQ
ncbi:TauD/TfdA family dioxygenase [Thalassospiraceae bacterium LMO-JJ14]|nr:TauD/TfdA family dioxygenase [Thalassospiraceae bacterium LMO-JJ14]